MTICAALPSCLWLLVEKCLKTYLTLVCFLISTSVTCETVQWQSSEGLSLHMTGWAAAVCSQLRRWLPTWGWPVVGDRGGIPLSAGRTPYGGPWLCLCTILARGWCFGNDLGGSVGVVCGFVRLRPLSLLLVGYWMMAHLPQGWCWADCGSRGFSNSPGLSCRFGLHRALTSSDPGFLQWALWLPTGWLVLTAP